MTADSISNQYHQHGSPGASIAHRHLPSGQYIFIMTLKLHLFNERSIYHNYDIQIASLLMRQMNFNELWDVIMSL